MNFLIFTYRKLQAEKNKKFSFYFIRSVVLKNLNKHFRISIVKVFPIKSFFKNIPKIFYHELNKRSILTLIACNFVKNHRNLKKSIFKAKILLY